MMYRTAKNLKNKKFGRLTILKDTGKRRWGSIIWLCKCDCGNIKEIASPSLISGLTKSCGCYCKEINANLAKNRKGKDHGRFKHGGTKTKLYVRWKGIKQRCYNKKCKIYKYYGGRGIRVCDEWEKDFAAFRDWALENGLKSGLTIDRIDSKKGYYPGNCQFLTLSENVRKANHERRM